MPELWDIHNHLLPGVDDGSSCEEETFEMLKQEYRQGVKNIIFTPHYRHGMFEVSGEAIKEVFEQTVRTYNVSYACTIPGMRFFLGCEFHISSDFKIQLEIIKKQLSNTSVILAEFSDSDSLENILPVVRYIRKENMACIIAHAERYRLKEHEISLLQEQEECYIQINATSILGKEGFRKKVFTNRLLKARKVDFIASDAHDTRYRPVMLGECYRIIAAKYGNDYADMLFYRNAEKLFENK